MYQARRLDTLRYSGQSLQAINTHVALPPINRFQRSKNDRCCVGVDNSCQYHLLRIHHSQRIPMHVSSPIHETYIRNLLIDSQTSFGVLGALRRAPELHQPERPHVNGQYRQYRHRLVCGTPSHQDSPGPEIACQAGKHDNPSFWRRYSCELCRNCEELLYLGFN